MKIMIDFYLHKYTNTESIMSGIVAPHKHRHSFYKRQGQNMLNDILTAWEKDKKKILSLYITHLEKLFDKKETFLLFIPPTNTRIFIEDIVEKIKSEFPNIIDLVDCFNKKSDVNFGSDEFKNYTIEQLSEYIQIDNNKLSKVDNNVIKAFIADDVYSTGKTIELTKYLIKTSISNVIEIKSGVILITTKN